MIDLLLVALYMVSVLGVGIVSGLKVRDLQDYSVSKTAFSPFVLMAAIFATLVGGGSTMGVSEKVFSSGLVFLLACVGFVARDLIIAFFIVPKFDRFKGCISVGDIMAIYYGKVGKICVGIAGTLQSSIYLSMQLAAIGHLLSYFLGLPYPMGILIGVGIVVIYSSFGGIRAVTVTDVIQFSVLIVAIPITFTICLEVVGGFQGLLNSVPKEKLSFIPTSGDEIRFYSLVLVFVLPYMNPALVQRLLIGRTIKEVRAALMISALGRLPYYAMVGILGLVAYVLEPSLKADMAFPYLVNQILPVGIKGLVVSGVMAVIMSTADSFLHVAGLLLTHDVIKPIMGDRLSARAEFALARCVTAIIGTIALIAAMTNTNIIELNILAYVFWLPAIFVPLVAGIMGLCGSVRSLLWSGGFGIITYLLWKLLFYRLTFVDSLLPSVIVSAVVFFSFYYFERRRPRSLAAVDSFLGRFRHVKLRIDLGLNRTLKKSLLRFYSKKKMRFDALSLYPGSTHGRARVSLLRRLINALIESSAKRVEIFGAPYGLFVLFLVANFCVIPMVFANSSGQVTPIFIMYLRVFASGLSFILIMKEFWPLSFLRYLPVFWHLTLFLCLPYFAISMCLFSSCAIEWVINLVLTNFILGLLVDWRTYIASILGGLMLAALSFLLFGDTKQFDPNLFNFPILAYATLISLVVGAIFSRNKERELIEKLITFKALGGTIAHEMRTPLSSIYISASGLKEFLPALIEGYNLAKSSGMQVPKIPKLALDGMYGAPERMRYICQNALHIIDMLLLQLKGDDWSSHLSECSMENCINTALNEYCFRPNERQLIDVEGVVDFNFRGNSHLMLHILYNLMRNSFSFIDSENKGRISIWTSETRLYINLHFRDTAKGIKAEDLPHIFEHGFSKRNAGNGLGLYYCKKMMELMSGQISAISQDGEFTEFRLSFPKLK